MKKILFLIIISFAVYSNESFAFAVKVGISRAWTISEKIQAKNIKNKNFPIEFYDLDSILLTRISNLQVDVAVIPLTTYKNVFDRQNHLSKFVINEVVGEEDVGSFSLKKCNKKMNYSKLDTFYVDEFSPEYKLIIKNKSLSKKFKKLSYYEILTLMESEGLNCQAGVIGSSRFLKNLKNRDQYKFEKISSLPFILLVEEHFYKNRFSEIQTLKNTLFSELAQKSNTPNAFEELRQKVFDYNFSGTKFQLERLNEIIKPF
jgi:hypothetical protein